MNNLICIWWNPNICFNNNHNNNNGLLYGHQQNGWKQQRLHCCPLGQHFLECCFATSWNAENWGHQQNGWKQMRLNCRSLRHYLEHYFLTNQNTYNSHLKRLNIQSFLKKTVVKELFLEKDSALDLTLKLVISQKIRHIICC